MRKAIIHLTIVLLFTIVFSECKKEKSKIKGLITYVGVITGIEYYSKNAQIYLHYGEAALDDNPVVSTTEVNGYTYSGTSDVFTQAEMM